MQRVHAPLAALALLYASVLTSGCGPGEPADVCGQSGVVPTADDVQDGFGRADREEEPFSAAGSWAPGANASIDIGTLSLIVPNDETGTETADLISRRAFPICVPLGARSERSGSAIFGGVYLSNASHTGGVAILGEQGGLLLGRFSVELVHNNTSEELSFEGGVFRVGRR
jgi:hypothetical protein